MAARHRREVANSGLFPERTRFNEKPHSPARELTMLNYVSIMSMLERQQCGGGSSSGRTTGSEPVSGGSNPPPPANFRPLRSFPATSTDVGPLSRSSCAFPRLMILTAFHCSIEVYLLLVER